MQRRRNPHLVERLPGSRHLLDSTGHRGGSCERSRRSDDPLDGVFLNRRQDAQGDADTSIDFQPLRLCHGRHPCDQTDREPPRIATATILAEPSSPAGSGREDFRRHRFRDTLMGRQSGTQADSLVFYPHSRSLGSGASVPHRPPAPGPEDRPRSSPPAPGTSSSGVQSPHARRGGTRITVVARHANVGEDRATPTHARKDIFSTDGRTVIDGELRSSLASVTTHSSPDPIPSRRRPIHERPNRDPSGQRHHDAPCRSCPG